MTQQSRIVTRSTRTATAATPYWLWAPVLATTTMLAVLLFAPMPSVL
ncbi:hypothetical protein [Thiocapsa marina]|uniref:Uncharacterized protein n=1 Tax=Thiocapsa marina 5811 TaxID=768671 RepID=F9U808_9GAMM|nr:hypothetical protein [Thiocapsa marina]EGV19788.1 hypothetical protein ThimaDRAFT_1234 [Thiocapsa marina 5811]